MVMFKCEPGGVHLLFLERARYGTQKDIFISGMGGTRKW